MKIVEFYSQAYLLGPPASEELLAFAVNLFCPEEAEIVQHLPLIYGKTARSVARKTDRPVEEVEAILCPLAEKKRAIIAFEESEFHAILSGSGIEAQTNAVRSKPRKYGLMPLLPGVFDLPLVEGKDTEWHRRHGRLFEAIYQTGYLADTLKKPMPVTRYIPVEKAIDSVPAALPSDRLSELMEEHKSFALGVCQCRQARAFSGHDCGLPRENCMATGVWADYLVSKGIMRRAERSEAFEAKLRANEAGLATMSLNVDSREPGILCSCCGCCCVVLRTISQFNTPGLIAPPHFLPVRDQRLCAYCRACQEYCPMGAHSLKEAAWEFRRERCIGCGVCASICPKRAFSMEQVKDYRKPPANYKRLALTLAPGYFYNYLSIGSRR